MYFAALCIFNDEGRIHFGAYLTDSQQKLNGFLAENSFDRLLSKDRGVTLSELFYNLLTRTDIHQLSETHMKYVSCGDDQPKIRVYPELTEKVSRAFFREWELTDTGKQFFHQLRETSYDRVPHVAYFTVNDVRASFYIGENDMLGLMGH